MGTSLTWPPTIRIGSRRLPVGDGSAARATIAENGPVPLSGDLQPLTHTAPRHGMRRRRRLHQGSLRVPPSETPLLGGEPPRGAEHEPESTQRETADDKKMHVIVRWCEAERRPVE